MIPGARERIYASDYVRGLFDRMSGSYERVNYLTSFGFSLRWRRQFLDHVAASKEPIAIVDLMTGMGETWDGIRRRFPHAACTALDFSQGMLAHAAERNKKYRTGTFKLLQQDVLSNTLPDEGFDIVLCAFGLKTFDAAQLKMLAKEVERVLRPGGTFSFVEVSIPRNALLRVLYGLYLRHMVPLAGRLLLGDPAEYRLLWRYTSEFRHVGQAAELFRACGLVVEVDEYFGGCATGFHGRKRGGKE